MATIFALSSGAGRAALAVVRLSGPDSAAALARLTGDSVPADRRLRLRRLRDPRDGATIDDALVAAFSEGSSYTGESMVELHVHGGLAIRRRLLDALAAMSGLRLAEPGEFSRRAFERGRIDLAEAEGVAALIDAETEAQRAQAASLYEGELSRKIGAWRERLVGALALLTALIDFAEEEIPPEIEAEARAGLSKVATQIETELAGAAAASAVREGVEVALVGPPNVGKSSLLNALARRDAALTSPVAGTTRDVIEVRCDIGGRLVILMDLAGLRDAVEAVEAAGVARARERAARASIRIFIGDGTSRPELDLWREGDLLVINKMDLGVSPPEGWLGVSAATGAGLEALVEKLGQAAESRASGAGLVVAARHRAALSRAVDHLREAEKTPALDLAAEEARIAATALQSVVGCVDVDDLLDDVFGRFCVGK